jgi:hypothetical protein
MPECISPGGSRVLFGRRPATIDVDLRIFPESDRSLRAIPTPKKTLKINVELASPAEFIPEISGWEGRSIFIVQEGKLAFYHYDLYAQALAKIERGHSQDVEDVRSMIAAGRFDPAVALEFFEEIAPRPYLHIPPRCRGSLPLLMTV